MRRGVPTPSAVSPRVFRALRGARVVSYVRRDSSLDCFDVAPSPTQVMTGASKKAIAERNLRHDKLRQELGYPKGFDIDANRLQVIQDYVRIHKNRHWTDHNGKLLTLGQQSDRSQLLFKPRKEKKETPADAVAGTARPADAVAFLERIGPQPVLRHVIHVGKGPIMQKWWKEMFWENRTVQVTPSLVLGGSAFCPYYPVFARVCFVSVSDSTRMIRGTVIPQETVDIFRKTQRRPPVWTNNWRGECNEDVWDALTDGSAFVKLCEVNAEDANRDLAGRVEVEAHKMGLRASMPFDIRKRMRTGTWLDPKELDFATVGSLREPKLPLWQRGDRFQCWLVLHAAHCFRVPTEQERAAQLASLEGQKKSKKARKAEGADGPKKKTTAMTDFFPVKN